MSNQHAKGQVLFKFLWQLDSYQVQGGVSPRLAGDLKNAVVRNDATTHTKTITTKQIFNWINGSVIPAWARKAAFQLALEHGWRPVDLTDVETMVFIVSKEIKSSDLAAIVRHCESHYKVSVPKALLVKM